jgi:hydrogenase maturation protease
MTQRIVVLGVGNELRSDDAVGLVVARGVAERPLPPNVDVVEGHTGGINLLFELEQTDWAVIVDAVDMGGEPGDVAVFDAEEADVRVVERVASLHHVSLADVLELARLTGVRTRVTIVGIQPQTTLPGEKLSEAVAARVDEVVELVRRMVLAEGGQEAHSGSGKVGRKLTTGRCKQEDQ